MVNKMTKAISFEVLHNREYVLCQVPGSEVTQKYEHLKSYETLQSDLGAHCERVEAAKQSAPKAASYSLM